MTNITPRVICRGAKLLLLKVNEINLKIIDSHCFIATSLSKFTKTFGLSNTLSKGYFPYFFFNKLEIMLDHYQILNITEPTL